MLSIKKWQKIFCLNYQYEQCSKTNFQKSYCIAELGNCNCNLKFLEDDILKFEDVTRLKHSSSVGIIQELVEYLLENWNGLVCSFEEKYILSDNLVQFLVILILDFFSDLINQ